MINAKIIKCTKNDDNNVAVILVKDKNFNPNVGQIIAIIPDKIKVDTKRKQIFAFIKWLAINADYLALFGSDSKFFEGHYIRNIGWETNEQAEWFRALLLMNAGLTEPSRNYYYVDGKRKSFDGIKPKSLDRYNSSLKDLEIIYEELKRYSAEQGIDLENWHNLEEGYHE